MLQHTAQHSTAMHSKAQHGTAQHGTALPPSPGVSRLAFLPGTKALGVVHPRDLQAAAAQLAQVNNCSGRFLLRIAD
jgi:hypothetical protein